jgi:C1A family cysteine protease
VFTPSGHFISFFLPYDDSFLDLKNNETDLLNAVATLPVNVNMDANCQSFLYYKSGVLDDATCTRNVGHCITAVGYGTDTSVGKDYWIFKNMWGTGWGDKGFIKLVRNKNQCGIVTSKDFPNAYPQLQ